MNSKRGRSRLGRPMQVAGPQVLSQPFTFQHYSPEAQATTSTPQPEPFRFQGSTKTTSLSQHPQSFTFEADPAYPIPVLSLGDTHRNTLSQSISTNTVSNLIHELECLRQQDETTALPPDHPPSKNTRAALLRRRRDLEYQEVAARTARTDAERLAKQVKRQSIRDDNEARRKAAAHTQVEGEAGLPERRRRRRRQSQKDSQVQTASPFPPISPATIISPQVSFATSLTYRPASRPSQGLWCMQETPLPSPQFPKRDAMQKPSQLTPSRNPYTLMKTVAQNPADSATFKVPKQPKSVRFNEVVDIREDSAGSDDK